jgi:hypothetical protein
METTAQLIEKISGLGTVNCEILASLRKRRTFRFPWRSDDLEMRLAERELAKITIPNIFNDYNRNNVHNGIPHPPEVLEFPGLLHFDDIEDGIKVFTRISKKYIFFGDNDMVHGTLRNILGIFETIQVYLGKLDELNPKNQINYH